MERTLRIGIDVDDVLVESLPAYLAAFRDRFCLEVPIEEAAWEVFRRFPDISPAELGEFFGELDSSDFLGRRPVYPEAVQGVRELARAGHRLVVVTGRLTEHLGSTRRLLVQAGILDRFEALVHRDGVAAAVEYKPRVAREHRLDLLIDDERHVAEAVARVPIPVLLFDRPWNRGELPPGISRVRSWGEVVRAVRLQAESVRGG